jgi:hypothetical protein
MSLKHTQLQDSIIGRSYVKIAQEKGWIQEEPLKKEAAVSDYQPTENLTENILILCRGLRQTGLDKYAVELETKFLQFKAADCHYDVSGEKGEDLIEAAHPKGSHKLEGLESEEATIETVLDQHLKILEKILKMPHGKLSTSGEIIDAVKVVLGQDATAVEKDIDTHMVKASNTFDYVDGLISKEGGLSFAGGILGFGPTSPFGKKVPWMVVSRMIKKGLATRPATLLSIKGIEEKLDGIQDAIEPTFWGGGVETNIWSNVQKGFKQIRDHLNAAKLSVQKLLEISASKALSEPTESKFESAAPGFSDLMRQFDDNITVLKAWRQQLTSRGEDVSAIGWVDKKLHQLSTLRLGYGMLSTEERQRQSGVYSNQLKQITGQLPEFKREWID